MNQSLSQAFEEYSRQIAQQRQQTELPQEYPQYNKVAYSTSMSAILFYPTEIPEIAGGGNSNTTQFPGDHVLRIEDFELAEAQTKAGLTILYALTAIVALLGNMISIMVLLRGKRSSRELRLFLVNLSVSDILMALFSIPFTFTSFIWGRWIFGAFFCPVVMTIQLLSVFVSIYTLTIIGVDRYIAITRPFFVSFWSRSFAPTIVGIIWITGGAISLIPLMRSRLEPFVEIDHLTYYECNEKWDDKRMDQYYTLTLFFVIFAFPLLVLSFVYGSISLTLWRHSAPGNAHPSRDGAANSAKIKVIKMLMTIVLLFAFCWAPWHAYHLVRAFRQDWLKEVMDHDAGSTKHLFVVITAHWLSMANSCVNPIIYCFMSDNFRIDLKNIAKKAMDIRRLYSLCCGVGLSSSLSSSTQSMPGIGQCQCQHPHHHHHTQSGRTIEGHSLRRMLTSGSGGGGGKARNGTGNTALTGTLPIGTSAHPNGCPSRSHGGCGGGGGGGGGSSHRNSCANSRSGGGGNSRSGNSRSGNSRSGSSCGSLNNSVGNGNGNNGSTGGNCNHNQSGHGVRFHRSSNGAKSSRPDRQNFTFESVELQIYNHCPDHSPVDEM